MFGFSCQPITKNLLILDKLKYLSYTINEGQYQIQKRYKKGKKKAANTDRALEYFDSIYSPLFDKKWDVMKKALVEDPKYVAIINNFSDNEVVLKKFQEIGAFDVGGFYIKKALTVLQNDANRNQKSFVDSTVEKQPIDSIRPSLIKMTDDEKVALNETTDIERYPEVYKQRVTENLGNQEEFHSSSARVIKVSAMGDAASISHGHIPSTKLKGLEEWVEESDVFRGAQDPSHAVGFKIVNDDVPLDWPKNLKIYSFIKGEHLSNFPSPRPSPLMELFPHCLLNGASVLPVLALDLQQGDHVLDLCAGPGVKSLLMLQTLKPGSLTCNDKSKARIDRVKKLFHQYIPRELSSIWNIVSYTVGCGTELTEENYFDKVLVDAPCLNDRFSLQESDNSIFKTTRTKERLKMPELQANLIFTALKSAKPGGCVVYSTCTLSPLQNDGAVHLALTKVWRETQMDCTVIDMTPTMKNLSFMYNFGDELGLRYGHIVLPSICNNYGPMYVSKIVRVK